MVVRVGFDLEAREDRLHGRDRGSSKARIVARPAHRQPGRESAQRVSRRVRARVVPRLDRAPEQRHGLVPPPERVEGQHAPHI